MKVLLVAVNAKYIHSNLAIYSLKAYAKPYGDWIKLAEYTINHHLLDILEGIYEEQADVVAFSCYIWNIEIITRLASQLRKVQPTVKIWFGGPEVSYDAEVCLREHPEWDGIMIGEGEQTFLELMEYYNDHSRKLDAIAGIAYRESAGMSRMEQEDSGKIRVTMPRMPLSLDEIPFPYEDMESFNNKIIYYESSRGCPFFCSYCLSSIDRRVRFRNLERVRKELGTFLEHGISQVKFVDRTFNCNREHSMEIWQFIKDKDNGITNFHFEISADLLTEEEISFLSTLRPGQVQFEIGVQSTNPETIAAINRKTDFRKLSNNVRQIQAGHNIHQHLDLIAGLPMEDYASFEQSFGDVYALKPDQLQMGFLKILKGSRMKEESSTYKIESQNSPPYEVLMTNCLSFEELLCLKGISEMVEIYYNSGQFRYALCFLEHFFESPMKLYQALSMYYKKNGLHLIGHSRVRRYEILLDFYKENILEHRGIQEEQEEQEKQEISDVFEEILVLDLYLREDMKSRPSFAHNNLDHGKVREILVSHNIDRKCTHIEYFTYDVIASSKIGEGVKQESLVAFDYSSRDPLHKAAKLIVLEH